VFHNRRWDSDFLTLSRLLAERRLGEIAAFHARWDRYRPQVEDRWRERAAPGTGMFYDLGSHLIDQTLCLFGMPDWIQADVFAQRVGAQADDGFELLMGKGALRISLGGSSLAAANRFRYRVLGTQATFTKSGRDPQEQRLRNGVEPSTPGFGDEPASDYGRLTHGNTDRIEIVRSEPGRWLTFYEAMRRSIENNAPVPVTAVEARSTLLVTEAALLSSSAGRRIKLN
jgi:scyllo-inositol 2-dehydrogenase (NADP+)